MFNPNQLTLTNNIKEMEVQQFIKKWNVAFEDKEQEMLFASQMEADLKSIQQVKPPVALEEGSKELECENCGTKDDLMAFCGRCSNP